MNISWFIYLHSRLVCVIKAYPLSLDTRDLAHRLRVLFYVWMQIMLATESETRVPRFPAVPIVGCLLALFTLIGCSSTSQTPAQPFATVTLPPNPKTIPPFATPTTWITTTPTSSRLLTPTATPMPTMTPYPTQTETPPPGVPKGVTMDAGWGPILSAAFSPDGKILATGDYGGKIFLWDMTTHQAIGEPLAGQKDGVYGLAFSPDGKTLASVGCVRTGRGRECRDGTYLWDVTRRLIIGQLETGYTHSVVFSPDGRFLATIGCQEYNCLELWDLATIKRTTGDWLDGSVVSMDISPDGKLIAWIDYYNDVLHDNYTVSIWSTTTQQLVGEPLRNLADKGDIIRFEPDGHSLAIAGPHGFVVWNINEHKVVDQMRIIPKSYVEAIALSPDGRILAIGSGEIILWDTKSHQRFAQPINRVEGGGTIMALAFSPDGNILASGKGGTVSLWGVKYYPLSDAPPGLIAFTSNRDGKENIYTMYGDGADPHIFMGSEADYSEAAWSPSGQYMAFCSNRDGNWGIDVKEVGEYYAPWKLTTLSQNSCSQLAWSPDSSSVAFICGNDICVADVQGSYLEPRIRHIASNPDYNYSVAWSPDGKLIALAGIEGISVINGDGTNRHLLISGSTIDLEWSPDGRSIVYLKSERDEFGQISSLGGEIFVANADGTNPRQLVTNTGSWEPKWSPNSHLLAFVSSGDPGAIFLANNDGTGLRQLYQFFSRAGHSLSWSPDGNAIAFTDNGKIYVLRIADGQIFGGVQGDSPVWSPY
jgi:WD40 repeat protein